jgi:tetratricopeptide (TPR) repeat protein
MRKKSAVLLIIPLLFSISCARQKPAESQAALVFTHVTIVDTSGGPNQIDMTVFITGDRITAVEKTGKARAPRGAQVIDAAGKFLIPGLWDMHVHWYDTRYLPLFIANGVTGVRQMWGSPVHFQWRDEISKGLLLGPRQAIAGIPIDGAEAFYPGVIRVGNENEARQAVKRVKDSGADFVEVDGGLSREAYFAIADESRKLGIPFAGGVPRSIRAAEASEAGQKSIEYLGALGPGLYLDYSDNEDELRKRGQKSREGFSARQPRTREQLEDIREQQETVFETYDAGKAAALFALFVKNGTWQCPTLTVQKGLCYLDDQNFTNDLRLKYMPKFMHGIALKTLWDPKSNSFVSSNTAEDWAMSKKVFAKKLEIIGPMRRAGVKFIAGTDLANPYCFPGFSLHDELGLLVKGGLTPMEALQAATYNAAEFLGLKDALGTVEAGKIADLVLLEADPTADIGNTRKIAAVVVNGKYHSRSSLDEMLAKIETIAGLPSIAEPLLNTIAEKDVQSAIRQYHELKAAQPDAYDFSEEELNSLASALFRAKKLKEAIEILKFNVDMHPESFSAYDSLAEAYLNNGDQELAIKYFEKSLELNRFNWNAVETLKKLKTE